MGVAAGTVASAALAVPANVKLALNDPKIVQGRVQFPNGPAMIDGYLARPRAPGRYKAVLTLCGPDGLPNIVTNAAAMLAEAGFVGLAVSWSSREADPFADRDFICSDAMMQRWVDDCRAGLAYLKSQSFVADGNAGVVGFCGGGVAALHFAARSTDLGAAVAYYAPPRTLPRQCTEPKDSRKAPISFIGDLKSPVQFHVGTRDDLISLDDIAALRAELQRNSNPADVYVYEGARHAFHDVDRADFYNVQAAKLSWQRTLRFLRRNLSA
jgi:carboxymethylenebutenolidase